jgi:hypothetical protein
MNKFRTVVQLDFLSPLNGYSQVTTKLTANAVRSGHGAAAPVFIAVFLKKSCMKPAQNRLHFFLGPTFARQHALQYGCPPFA